MAYVSVGQVENLQEAINSLLSAYDSMESACQAQIAAAEAKLAETQKEAENSAQLLDAALESEIEAGQQLELAHDQLSSANVRSSSACSSNNWKRYSSLCKGLLIFFEMRVGFCMNEDDAGSFVCGSIGKFKGLEKDNCAVFADRLKNQVYWFHLYI